MLKKLLSISLVLISYTALALPIYSPSQMQVIHERGYLRVAILNESLAPFTIVNSDTSLTGIDIEMAHEAAAILGVKVQFDRSAKTYEELLQRVYDKKDDIAISGIIRTPTRAQSVQFSSPYYTYPIGLLVNRIKYDKLNGNLFTAFNAAKIKIGVLKDGAFVGYVEYLYPKAKLVLYESIAQMLQDVELDKIDASMMDELVVRKWLSEKPERALRTRYLVIPNYHAAYSIATSYDYQKFGQWLNEFIDEAKAIGVTERLLKKYTQDENNAATPH